MKVKELFDGKINLNEILDTVVSTKWITDKSLDSGFFELNGDEYRIDLESGDFKAKDICIDFINIAFFIKDGNGIWSLDPTYNNASVSKVIGAITNAIKERLDIYEYDAIIFGSTDLADKRMRVYGHMIRRAIKKLGSFKENIPVDNGLITIVFNSDKDSVYKEFEEHTKEVGK